MDRTLIKVGACFFLSGLAALLYQTAWMRQLSVVFGTSELAVATVLTAYMSGLALGAALAGKYIKQIKRPLLTYGVFEGGIALTAIAVPFLLKFAAVVFAWMLGGQPEPPASSGFGQLLFFYLTTLGILVLPTALMGATLPLLSKYAIETNEQVGRRIGGLYAINTFGAIAGTLVAGFILLPNITLMSTILIGAAINLLVLYIVLKIVKVKEGSEIGSHDSMHVRTSHGLRFWRHDSGLILPFMTASGVATFTYEVLWTRLLSHILGGSVAAFSIMLAGFLSGIALGSEIASRYASSKRAARLGFVVCQLGIGLTSAATFLALDFLIPDIPGLFKNSALAFLVLLPSTVFIGATFPFAVRLLAKDENDAASSSAAVYAWNTVGAIVGATFAGFFLIPSVRYEGAIVFAVGLNLVLAVLATEFWRRSERKTLGVNPVVVGLFLSITVLTFLFFRPTPPYKALLSSPLAGEVLTEEQIEFYEVGRSSTVLLASLDGYYRLRNNGLPESAIVTKVPPQVFDQTHFLSLLPVLARPQARNMLVAGFGGGVVVENLAPSIERVDVMELEPKVIDANRQFSELRRYDPLQDPRVNIILNDARGALALTDKRYDIIVSQPSHPWTAGASHLYTKEYMTLVKDHLTDKGVFLQWMNISFTDEYLLRSLTRTLTDTFEFVRLYSFSPGVLFFLAADTPLEMEQAMLESDQPFKTFPDYYSRLGLMSAESLLAGLMLDNQGAREFAKLGTSISDNYNLLGTRSALSVEAGNAIDAATLNQYFLSTSPVFDQSSWIYQPNAGVDFTRLSSNLSRLNYAPFNTTLHKNLAQLDHPQFPGMRALALTSTDQALAKQTLGELLAKQYDESLAYQLLFHHRLDGNVEFKDEFFDFYQRLNPTAAAVIDHVDLLRIETLATNAESELEPLDAQLAISKADDVWHRNATLLRARWRVEKALVTGDKRWGAEGLDLIDQLTPNSIDLFANELRLKAAAVAGDVDVMLFQIRVFNNAVQNYLSQIDDPIRFVDKKTLKTYQQILRRIDALDLPKRMTVNDDEQNKLTLVLEQSNALLKQLVSAQQRV